MNCWHINRVQKLHQMNQVTIKAWQGFNTPSRIFDNRDLQLTSLSTLQEAPVQHELHFQGRPTADRYGVPWDRCFRNNVYKEHREIASVRELPRSMLRDSQILHIV
jgi:hypothetical protein